MFRKILENGRLQVTIPFKFRTISSRKKIVVPGTIADGTEPLALGLARAFRWQRYIDEGKFRNIRELAKAIGQDETAVAKTMRLRMLSPAIVHRIVTGDIPRSLNMTNIHHGIPEVWSEQEEKWISGDVLSWGEG